MIYGGVDDSTIGCFLLNMLEKYPEILVPSQRYCIVWDNARIHHSKKLKTLRSYLKIFFLPPYSPFLNPIEETFGLIKFHYRKNILKNNLNLSKNIVDSVKLLEERHFHAFYYHSLCFFNNCFDNLHIL